MKIENDTLMQLNVSITLQLHSNALHYSWVMERATMKKKITKVPFKEKELEHRNACGKTVLTWHRLK